MAQRFFVHEGLQFETIDIMRSDFDSLSGSDGITAVTLESIATILGDDVLGPGTPAAQLAALRSWWADTTIDRFLQIAKEIVQKKSNVIGSPKADVNVGVGLTRNFHETSYQWILPEGLSNCIKPLSTSATVPVTSVQDGRNVLMVKSLEIRHDNIRKYTSASDAWDAWIAYTITKETEEDEALANSGYLINPSSS